MRSSSKTVSKLTEATKLLFSAGTDDPSFEEIGVKWLDGEGSLSPHLVQQISDMVCDRIPRIRKQLDEVGISTRPMPQKWYDSEESGGLGRKMPASAALADIVLRGKPVGILYLKGPSPMADAIMLRLYDRMVKGIRGCVAEFEKADQRGILSAETAKLFKQSAALLGNGAKGNQEP